MNKVGLIGISILMLASCSDNGLVPSEQRPVIIDDPLEGVFEVHVCCEMNHDCWPYSANLEGRYAVRIDGWTITFGGMTGHYYRDSNTSTIAPHIAECRFGSGASQRCRALEWNLRFLSNDVFMGTVTAYVSETGGGATICTELYEIFAARVDGAGSNWDILSYNESGCLAD